MPSTEILSRPENSRLAVSSVALIKYNSLTSEFKYTDIKPALQNLKQKLGWGDALLTDIFVDPKTQIKTLKAKERILHSAKPLSGPEGSTALILSGAAKAFIQTQTSKDSIFDIGYKHDLMLPEQFFSSMRSENSALSMNIEALGPTQLLLIPNKVLLKHCLSDPGLGKTIAMTERRIRITSYMKSNCSQQTKYGLFFSALTPGQGEYAFTPIDTIGAQYLGMTREMFNYARKPDKKQGLDGISDDHYRSVKWLTIREIDVELLTNSILTRFRPKYDDTLSKIKEAGPLHACDSI